MIKTEKAAEIAITVFSKVVACIFNFLFHQTLNCFFGESSLPIARFQIFNKLNIFGIIFILLQFNIYDCCYYSRRIVSLTMHPILLDDMFSYVINVNIQITIRDSVFFSSIFIDPFSVTGITSPWQNRTIDSGHCFRTRCKGIDEVT